MGNLGFKNTLQSCAKAKYRINFQVSYLNRQSSIVLNSMVFNIYSNVIHF